MTAHHPALPLSASAIAMADAEVRLQPSFYAPNDAAALFDALLASVPWRQENIRLFGREHAQPRLTSWHGDPNCRYSYSGLALEVQPWTPELARLRDDLHARTGFVFNSVLCNLYRDGNDSVGWHSDDERELGENPAIASLSFGQTRTFRLRHRQGKETPVSLELVSGSLLLMSGATQRCWRHAVPKQPGRDGARINLTFRRILGI